MSDEPEIPPVLGQYIGYMAQEIQDAKIRLVAEALEKGLSGNDRIDYVFSKAGDFTWKISLYRITGEKIASQTFNAAGF